MPILTKEMPAEREVNKRVGALHELLMKILSNSVAAVRPTVITVASCNDLKEGLWLLHHATIAGFWRGFDSEVASG